MKLGELARLFSYKCPRIDSMFIEFGSQCQKSNRVLDVVFDAGACYVKTSNVQQNIAFMRRIASNIINSEKVSRQNLKGKRQQQRV